MALTLMAGRVIADDGATTFYDLRGPYLGQTPPGDTAELFAPGIVADIHHEHSAAIFSPAGDELYWTVVFMPIQSPLPAVIMRMGMENGRWTEPEVAPFSGQYSDDVGGFSPDGNRLYYSSRRPLPGESEPNDKADIWYVERTPSGWSEPIWLDSPVNSENYESEPKITKRGNLYYLGFLPDVRGNYGIYRARQLDGRFIDPVALGPNINSEYNDWCPYVDPEERYLIFSSNREGGYGRLDLYVSFVQDDGTWGEPINLGRTVNTDDNERFPAVSPDGKYLFFLSKRTPLPKHFDRSMSAEDLIEMGQTITNGLSNIYWIDADIIDRLQKDQAGIK
jgi:hypothetical protein